MSGRFPVAGTLVLVGAILALASTRAASSETTLAIELLVVVMALITALRPDHHLGLLVILLVGFHWLATVDAATTPWSITTAASLALVHSATAAASIAPPATPWTPAMTRRWTRRFVTVTAPSTLTWLIVIAVDRADPASSPALLTAALLVLAAAGLWARHGNLRTTSESPPL